jgi:hypothetical protein
MKGHGRALTFTEAQRYASAAVNQDCSETERRLCVSILLIEIRRLQAQHGMRLIQGETK